MEKGKCMETFLKRLKKQYQTFERQLKCIPTGERPKESKYRKSKKKVRKTEELRPKAH